MRFTEAKENSIWGKLYRNKVDEESSFFGTINGIEHILKEPKTAFIQHGDVLRHYSEYHCKVCVAYHLEK